MKKTSQGNVEVQYYIPDKPPTERSPLLNTKSMGGSIYWPKDKGKFMVVLSNDRQFFLIYMQLIITAHIRSLRQGHFSQACVILFTVGVCIPTMPWGRKIPLARRQTPVWPGPRHPPPLLPGGRPPPSEDRQSTGGRYASYWNTHLLVI